MLQKNAILNIESNTILWCEFFIPQLIEYLQDHPQIAEQLSDVQQAQGMIPSVRQRFLARRFGLRKILSRALDCTPHEVPLSHTSLGQPYLILPEGHPLAHLRISTSSSEDWGVVVFAAQGCCGIDLEIPKSLADQCQLAPLFLTTTELNQWHALPDEKKEEAFYTFWMAKEAFLKAVGTGFLTSPYEVEFCLDQEMSINLQKLTGSLKKFSVEDWHFKKIKINAKYPCVVLASFKIKDLFFIDIF